MDKITDQFLALEDFNQGNNPFQYSDKKSRMTKDIKDTFNHKKETHFKGLPISPGIAHARVCLFNENRHNNLPIYRVEGKGIEREKKRFKKAAELSSTHLESIIKTTRERLGDVEAEIFAAQKMILDDIGLHEKIIKELEKKNVNAETAIISVLEILEAKIFELNNDYIRERATDIGEVKRRLLDFLSNMNPEFQCSGTEYCQRGKHRIVVAIELTPSLTMMMDTQYTLGFVTEKGGTGSHAAILARALRIPAVSGIKGIHGMLYCGTEVLINGDTGDVYVWPSEETIQKFSKQKRISEEVASIDPIPEIKIMANLSLSKDLPEVIEFKAEGVGLYRTEFELLSAGRLLSEDEQYEKYTSVIKAMEGKSVYFRLFDIGGDKTAPFLNLPKEENPYLGFRGSRLLAERLDLFGPQVRALARASQWGPVNIMYPMVIEVEQFKKLKALFLSETKGIDTSKLKQGLMFEVPSACYQAEELLNLADFASIGSNDLIQYFFAVDRNNELVSYDYDPDRPVFWDFLKSIADAAKRTGKPLSVCGEIASNPKYVSKLLQVGIRCISTSPKLIPELRIALRNNRKKNNH